MTKTLWGGFGAALTLAIMLVSVVPATMLLLFTDEERDDPGFAIGGLSDAVPAEYAEWVLKAGQICPEVPPALIAAQIESESNWNPNATSPVGAKGIAQFMPFNFHLIKDENDNGTASALDPADAIMAQGRFMCGFVPMFSPAASGEELMRFLAAAYNAGPGAVLPRGCGKADTGRCSPSIPNNGETPPYVDRIMSLMAKYQAAEIPLDAASGAWIHPVTNYSVGGTYRQIGRHWRMCGWHTGYDYSAPMGTPIRAASAGTVVHAAWGSEAGGTGGAYGNQVIVQHPDGKRTYYAHMSAFAVTKGQQITTGQLLGQVGNTGNSFGAHLHFEMTKNATVSCTSFLDGHAYINDAAKNATTLSLTKPAAGTAQAVIAAARSQLGVRYSYGGGSLSGPSANMAGVVGFDCSSLVRYAWYQGSGKRITLPRTSQEQAAKLRTVSTPEPGDLIVFQLNSSQYDHVGLYLGSGKMIHAPNPRKTIEIVDVTSGYYANHPHSYRRPS